jgi:hypothetical protein
MREINTRALKIKVKGDGDYVRLTMIECLDGTAIVFPIPIDKCNELSAAIKDEASAIRNKKVRQLIQAAKEIDLELARRLSLLVDEMEDE